MQQLDGSVSNSAKQTHVEKAVLPELDAVFFSHLKEDYINSIES